MTRFHDEEVRPVEQEMKSENKMMEFATKIRSLTYGMCRVGPGPYGFGVCNVNPARIGMIIRIDPDPYSHVFPRTEENAIHTVTVEAFIKGEKQLFVKALFAIWDMKRKNYCTKYILQKKPLSSGFMQVILNS